jgi:GNAT superfamily N-acetyltransferase
MTLRIRSAERNDLTSVLELYRHLGETNLGSNLPELHRVWREMLAQPGLTCILGLYDDNVVSSCCIVIVPNLTHGGHPYSLVENVVTRRDFRKRGFGTAVVKHALSLAWASGCYKAMLLTGSRRPETHRFYQECGFLADDKIGFVARPPGPS